MSNKKTSKLTKIALVSTISVSALTGLGISSVSADELATTGNTQISQVIENNPIHVLAELSDNAYLTSIRASYGHMMPMFHKYQQNYNLFIPKGTKIIQFSATTEDSKAKMYFDGVPLTSGGISQTIDVSGVTKETPSTHYIQVHAEDGVTIQTYEVKLLPLTEDDEWMLPDEPTDGGESEEIPKEPTNSDDNKEQPSNPDEDDTEQSTSPDNGVDEEVEPKNPEVILPDPPVVSENGEEGPPATTPTEIDYKEEGEVAKPESTDNKNETPKQENNALSKQENNTTPINTEKQPVKVESNNQTTSQPKTNQVKTKQEGGHELPNTATPMFNSIFGGALALLMGASTLFVSKRKRKTKQ